VVFASFGQPKEGAIATASGDENVFWNQGNDIVPLGKRTVI
jgi:hypothetical protein